MKLSISVLLKKESGGWQNILYEIIDSALNDNYDLLKKELVKKLAIKVNKSEKQVLLQLFWSLETKTYHIFCHQ